MSGPTVEIELRLEKEKAEKSAKAFAANTAQALTGLASGVELTGKLFEGVGKVIEASVGAVVGWVKAAADADDINGKLHRQVEGLERGFGQLQVTLGTAALKSGAAKDGMKAVEAAAGELTAFFESPEGRKSVDEFFRLIAGWSADLIEAALGAKHAWQDFTGFIEKRLFQWGIKDIIVAPLEEAESEATEILARLAGKLRATSLAPTSFEAGPSPTFKTADDKTRSSSAAEKLKNEDELIASLTEDANRTRRARAKRAHDEDMALFLRRAKEDQAAILLGGRQAAGAQDEAAEIESRARQSITDLEEDEREQIRQQQAAAEDAFQAQMVDIGVAGFANFVSGIVSSAIQGKLDVGAALAGFLGQILSQIGQALIALGTAGLATATSSTPMPILWGATGGPAGIPASLGIIAAGAILAGVGGGISGLASGGGGGGGSSRAGAPSAGGVHGRGAGAPAPSAAGTGFQAAERSSEPRITNINVSLSGLVSGTERGLARELRRVLAAGASLRPGG